MLLRCPICKNELEKQGRSAVCKNNHCFDYAKQGYLNLLLKQSKDHGDNKQMVQARTDFLNQGHYQFLKEAIASSILKVQPKTLADLGCGEGYYTSGFPCETIFGFDLSKDALKHASANDKHAQYVISSIFNLPLKDETMDYITTCFAPFAKDEIERLLKKDGHFLYVTPGPKHLYELKEQLYKTPYLNVVEDLDTSLQLKETMLVEETMHLNHQELIDLFQMTPYAYKTGKEGMEILDKIDYLDVTAEFVIRIYQKA